MGMRLGRRFLAAFALCLIAVVQATAQTPGTITGRATDAESGEGLASAGVEVISASGRVVATGLTDQQGNFRIANVPSGTYSVVFSHIGYQTTRIADVRVVGGETTMTGAAMASSAFVLNPVVISVSKKAEKAVGAIQEVNTVGEEAIEVRPSTTLVDHLRNTPGVDIMTTGVQATNVVVRGFNNIFSGALHTLTDFRIAGVPSLRVNFLHFLPQTDDDISRIEVVLGPGSALYGPNTANGVLHFITKSPLDEQGSVVSIAGGHHGTNDAPPTSAGFIAGPEPSTGLFHAQFRTSQRLSDRFGFKVSGQYLQADEYLYRDKSEDSTKTALPTTDAQLQATPLFPTGMSLADRQARANRIANRDFDIKRWSGDARADFRVTDNLIAVLSGGITNDNSIELTGIGAGQAVDWKYSYMQARANFHNWFAQTYINMSDAGETYLLRNGAPITDKSKVWVSQLQHQLNLGTRQSFTYGADYIATTPVTEGTINGANEDNDEYNEFGAYLQSHTSLSRMFDVVLAGRYDKHSELEDAVFSPRAGRRRRPRAQSACRNGRRERRRTSGRAKCGSAGRRRTRCTHHCLHWRR